LAIAAGSPQEKKVTNEPYRDELCPKLPVIDGKVEGKTMPAQNDKSCPRPRLVLAYADSAQAASCARRCRRQGWEVHQTHSGLGARQLAAAIEPALVVLDTDLGDESGWLTAAKLLLERPRQKILLAGDERSAFREQLALFLGAAGFIAREEVVNALEELAGVLAPVPV
jgi:ActR/RegA family two-component response regulator